jgi:hypothetical protein
MVQMLGHSLVTWRALPGGGQLQQGYVFCGGGVGEDRIPGGTRAALASKMEGRVESAVFHSMIIPFTQLTNAGAVGAAFHRGLLKIVSKLSKSRGWRVGCNTCMRSLCIVLGWRDSF